MAILPEERFWRTDTSVGGRHVYVCLTNDPTKPSPNDPLVGVMESSDVAQDIVDTHNGALSQYGRRYRKALTSPSTVNEPDPDEIYIKVSVSERVALIGIVSWLNSGMDNLGNATLRRALEKLFRGLGG